MSLVGHILDGRLEHLSECALSRHSSSDVLWHLANTFSVQYFQLLKWSVDRKWGYVTALKAG